MPAQGGITGSSPVPYREEGAIPSVTCKINGDQRDGLYELVRNHLGAVGDLWIALEQTEDFATAERLGIEFGEDFRLLEDIGWNGRDDRKSFDLTMPAHDLMELLQRLTRTLPRPPRSRALGLRGRAVKPAVRYLVNARFPRSRRVALAHRDEHQSRLRRLPVAGEDRSPLAGGLRDVELHAALEARSILAFLFAAPKPLARCALLAQSANYRLDGRPRCRRATCEVLREHPIDHPDLKARTRARAHDCLSLAVGGQRSEVSVEFLGAHRRGSRPLANLLDGRCLGGPVRREDQLHLSRFLVGHRVDLPIQLSLGHT